MAEDLQKSMFSGMIWTFMRQFSLQIFAFVQGVILARLLAPSDYGLIAMTTIFFAISGCFIDSGFATALVRKKDRTPVDYSTVFVTNVCLTAFFALLLSVCSPFIADFYNEPFLVTIVCCNALLLFLNSFLAIQNTKLTIDLDFKTQNIMRIITNITIGTITIIMALMGYGIWSLILPNFLMPFLAGYMYWHHNHWFPGFKFSWKSWREFFSFGSKMLASNLLDTTFNNIYPLVIGKKFDATTLGYYTRAQNYADLPSYTLLTVLGPVAFPVLCKIQDDDERLQKAYRRLIRLSAFIVFPMMIGLAVLARPAIFVLVTDKWEQSIPYLQLLCFAFMWYPLHRINLDLLQVKGRSDIFLRLEIAKKVFMVIVLFASIPLGVTYMCFGMVVSSLVCFFLNTYFVGKLINVNVLRQLLDVVPSLLYSLSMGALVMIFMSLTDNTLIQLLGGIAIGIVYYLIIARLFKSSELEYAQYIIQENIFNKIKNKSK